MYNIYEPELLDNSKFIMGLPIQDFYLLEIKTIFSENDGPFRINFMVPNRMSLKLPSISRAKSKYNSYWVMPDTVDRRLVELIQMFKQFRRDSSKRDTLNI